MTTLPPFPTDDTTLSLLMAAMDPRGHGDPEATQSSVWPLLEMLSELGGSDTRAVADDESGGDTVMMRDPQYSEHDVITALVHEIRRLRLYPIRRDTDTMTTPIIGQDVHYTSYGTPGGEFPMTCRAAKITEFNAGFDTHVGLCVINPTGFFFHSLNDGGSHYHDPRTESPGQPSWPGEHTHEKPFVSCACGWSAPGPRGGTWHRMGECS